MVMFGQKSVEFNRHTVSSSPEVLSLERCEQ